MTRSISGNINKSDDIEPQNSSKNVKTLTQKHEDQIDVQEVREADGGTDGFWQRNAEEFGFIKDGNGLYHSNSYMGDWKI